MASTIAPAAQRPSNSQRVVSNSANAPILTKPPCHIDPKAIISEKAILTGTHPISIGSSTVIHPYARLDSTSAPINVGRNCIIAERTIIGVSVESKPSTGESIQIDDYVTIETGAIIEAARIGMATTVGVNVRIQQGSVLGRFCKIPPTCTIARGESLPDYTVAIDSHQRRTDTTTQNRVDVQELKLKGQSMSVDALRKLIPSNIAKWQ